MRNLSTVALAFLLAVSGAMAASPVQGQLDALVAATQGKRLGIIMNPSGCDEQGRLDADYLLEQPGVNITAFFAPEHGLRGELPAGEGDGDYIDPETGIQVWAVYGSRNAPTPAQMQTIDALVFDLQDVGVRFYTFVWTMTHCMEAAAAAGKPFYVIDRPNPIDGMRVEGAPNIANYNLIGRLAQGAPFGVATRHGMTVGEIARMWNEEWMSPKVELHVIPMTDWTRDQKWDDTGRLFVPPSPNMRTTATATVYPATCIFEGTNLSEGRGTDKPFEKIGAPFIVSAEGYAETLNALNLPGVRFDPTTFTPTASKFWGRPCRGVEVVVTDADAFDPMRTALSMLKATYELRPSSVSITTHAANLMGIPNLETRIKTTSVEVLMQEWQARLAEFRELRRKYLIYPEPGPNASIAISNDQVELSWAASLGRHYQIHRRQTLSEPWQPLEENIRAVNPRVSLVQPLGEGSNFYRLELLP